MQEHIYNTKKQIYNSDVSYHYNSTTHCGQVDMRFHIVDFTYEHPESKRAKSLRNLIEYGWICKLPTQAPKGLRIDKLFSKAIINVLYH